MRTELEKQVGRIKADTQLIEEQIQNIDKLNIDKAEIQKTIKCIIASTEKLGIMIGND